MSLLDYAALLFFNVINSRQKATHLPFTMLVLNDYIENTTKNMCRQKMKTKSQCIKSIIIPNTNK